MTLQPKAVDLNSLTIKRYAFSLSSLKFWKNAHSWISKALGWRLLLKGTVSYSIRVDETTLGRRGECTVWGEESRNSCLHHPHTTSPFQGGFSELSWKSPKKHTVILRQTTESVPIRLPEPKTASSSPGREARSCLNTSLETGQPLGRLPQIPMAQVLLIHTLTL